MGKQLRPVSMQKIHIDDGFWLSIQNKNKEVTLNHVFEKLKEGGRFGNFRATIEEGGKYQGRAASDSDVYKWLEAASYELDKNPEPELREQVDEAISLIEKAQRKSGYINTYFSVAEPGMEWTNLSQTHELYCAGHLIQAAVAHEETTGSSDLLQVAERFADNIYESIGPEGSVKKGVPGHEGIEMALVDLYRNTEESRYLELAESFINRRGTDESPFEKEFNNLSEIAGAEKKKEAYKKMLSDSQGRYSGKYLQDHKPVRDQEKVEGHSVRAMYLYSGMADLAMETGDERLIGALEKLWDNMVHRRMYVTGGVGTSHRNEGFTADYDLPNETAFSETCAAIGSAMWNFRMLQLTGDSKYGDVMEKTLYNAFLAGVSLSGDKFFYLNPLAIRGGEHPLSGLGKRRFSVKRQGWFSTPCCPTNVIRTIASIEKYIYLKKQDELYINLYAGSKLETQIGESNLTLTQSTDYPWSGNVKIKVDLETPEQFTLKLRKPGWCKEFSLSIDGREQEFVEDKGFISIDRTWKPYTTLKLDMDMPVQSIQANPRVKDNVGRIALQHGPLIYCLEDADNDKPLDSIKVIGKDDFEVEYKSKLLNGSNVIKGMAERTKSGSWHDKLYQPVNALEDEEIDFMALPYHLWGHRGSDNMLVWLNSCLHCK